MAAWGLQNGEAVAIPANTRRPLSEAVKKSGGKPLFVELDARLELVADTPDLDAARLVWAQPVAGMDPPRALPGTTLFVDYGFNLPAPDLEAVPGAATLWGLHLSDGFKEDGALIAFNDDRLYRTATKLLQTDDTPDLNRVLAQCRRLSGPDGVAARQLARVAAAREGLECAAGLPMATSTAALPFGLIIRIPDEADVATFISYVRNENVPLAWLPELQPMFYVSYQATQDPARTRRTAENLARWIVVPIGPDFVEDELTHAVLGPVKGAEYTGVRWYTDPERASWYNDLMLEWYGPHHDAYRKAFNKTHPASEHRPATSQPAGSSTE